MESILFVGKFEKFLPCVDVSVNGEIGTKYGQKTLSIITDNQYGRC